ncbi:MAG: hypothetical protein ACM3QZ_07065 [Solirubrobacterales bacterium]
MARTARFEFQFVPQGTTVRPGLPFEPARNRYYIDVGNSDEYGVLDQHHKSSRSGDPHHFESTAGMILVHPDKVKANVSLDAAGSGEAVVFTIICHTFPDFDCFASIYILRDLLCAVSDAEIAAEQRPEPAVRNAFFRHLADYADRIDSGSIILDGAQLKTPYAIASVIAETIYANPNGAPPDRHTADHLILNRGLALIKAMETGFVEKQRRYQQNNDKLPNDITVLHDNELVALSGFEAEMTFLADDFSRYTDDLARRSAPDRTVSLPRITENGVMMEEADALFFTEPPTCSLHKHWARSDKSSPSGRGFEFTFIPMPGTKPQTLPNGNEVKTNRVVIALKEGAQTSLLGLGEALEAAELAAEQRLIDQGNFDIGRWRSRAQARWPKDAWCTNVDPWYDGRNQNYTIVDAPGNHYSLLPIAEIMEISKRFHVPVLDFNSSRHVIPFSFDSLDYPSLEKHFVNALNYTKYLLNDHDNFFLSYIQTYLFDEKADHCAFFRLGSDPEDSFLQVINEMRSQIIDGQHALLGSLRARIKDAYIGLFRYGVGFFVIEVELGNGYRSDLPFVQTAPFSNSDPANWITIEQLSAFNRRIRDMKEVFVRLIQEAAGKSQIVSMTSLDHFIYSAINMVPNSLHQKRVHEVALKLASHKDWHEKLPIGANDDLAGKMLFKENPLITYCISKNGAGLVSARDNARFAQQTLTGSVYWDLGFIIALLALHQRHILLGMASELSVHSKDNKSAGAMVSVLRESFLEFTIRSWFSQITNDENGMELFRRWQDIFENQIIYEEVSEQITAFDEFNQASFAKTMDTVSAVVFPLLAFGGFYAVLSDLNEHLPNVFGRAIVWEWVWLAVFVVLQLGWWKWMDFNPLRSRAGVDHVKESGKSAKSRHSKKVSRH